MKLACRKKVETSHELTIKIKKKNDKLSNSSIKICCIRKNFKAFKTP